MITDTGSKTVGALDVSDATPLLSCERGGRKVVMVSMFKDWDKSVRPVFCLTDREGNRIDYSGLFQPTEFNNDGKAISFITPAQPYIDKLLTDGRELRLMVIRDDHQESIKKFPLSI